MNTSILILALWCAVHFEFWPESFEQIFQTGPLPSITPPPNITSLYYTTPPTLIYCTSACPSGLSASIKNQWQLWLYLTNSWLHHHHPLPSWVGPIHFSFPCVVFFFSSRVYVLVFLPHPRGRTRGRVVVDEEDSMDGTEITESIGAQDTGETSLFYFFLIHYVHVGSVGSNRRLELSTSRQPHAGSASEDISVKVKESPSPGKE